MWTIAGTERVTEFADGRSVVGVFLATGYDQSTIGWVCDSWIQFDQDFSDRWHLLIPSRRDVMNKVTIRDFDVELSERLRESYGVPKEDLPCIVFDNYIETEKQIYVSLRGKNEGELRKFIESCKYIIEKHNRTDKSDRRFREETYRDIKNRAFVRDGVIPTALLSTRIVGSVIGFLSGLKSL